MRKQTNKTIRLTESDLYKIVRRVINEQNPDGVNPRLRAAVTLYEYGVDSFESAIELFDIAGEELPEELDNLFGGQGNESLSNLRREVNYLKGM